MFAEMVDLLTMNLQITKLSKMPPAPLIICPMKHAPIPSHEILDR
jgi:hypothetical protein